MLGGKGHQRMDTDNATTTASATVDFCPNLPSDSPLPPIKLKSLTVSSPANSTPIIAGDVWIHNISFNKHITVHASRPNGEFVGGMMLGAQYSESAEGNYEIWKFGGEVDGVSHGSKMYLRYEANGQSFYDNNGGDGINYTIPFREQKISSPVKSVNHPIAPTGKSVDAFIPSEKFNMDALDIDVPPIDTSYFTTHSVMENTKLLSGEPDDDKVQLELPSIVGQSLEAMKKLDVDASLTVGLSQDEKMDGMEQTAKISEEDKLDFVVGDDVEVHQTEPMTGKVEGVSDNGKAAAAVFECNKQAESMYENGESTATALESKADSVETETTDYGKSGATVPDFIADLIEATVPGLSKAFDDLDDAEISPATDEAIKHAPMDQEIKTGTTTDEKLFEPEFEGLRERVVKVSNEDETEDMSDMQPPTPAPTPVHFPTKNLHATNGKKASHQTEEKDDSPKSNSWKWIFLLGAVITVIVAVRIFR
ncbi:hypothetical protein BC829DRAFT_434354 [Chytridium lagenaria]|nr:hypothetical protein BC829DRAFT_434354 [Chytridium lagenaria]